MAVKGYFCGKECSECSIFELSGSKLISTAWKLPVLFFREKQVFGFQQGNSNAFAFTNNRNVREEFSITVQNEENFLANEKPLPTSTDHWKTNPFSANDVPSGHFEFLKKYTGGSSIDNLKLKTLRSPPGLLFGDKTATFYAYF